MLCGDYVSWQPNLVWGGIPIRSPNTVLQDEWGPRRACVTEQWALDGAQRQNQAAQNTWASQWPRDAVSYISNANNVKLTCLDKREEDKERENLFSNKALNWRGINWAGKKLTPLIITIYKFAFKKCHLGEFCWWGQTGMFAQLIWSWSVHAQSAIFALIWYDHVAICGLLNSSLLSFNECVDSFASHPTDTS